MNARDRMKAQIIQDTEKFISVLRGITGDDWQQQENTPNTPHDDKVTFNVGSKDAANATFALLEQAGILSRNDITRTDGGVKVTVQYHRGKGTLFEINKEEADIQTHHDSYTLRFDHALLGKKGSEIIDRMVEALVEAALQQNKGTSPLLP